ncbi:MAG TPA: signal peptide peptidase SppA [Candidatus Binatia bacterium]|nr:signal peptide peptidase SppA [Candidatus Binatia bacterium]
MGRRIRVILILLLLLSVVALFARAWIVGPRVKPGSVLLVDLSGAYAEAPPADLVGRWLRHREPTLIELITMLKKAAADERIKGVVLHVTQLEIGWAKAQEIRDAIAAFKRSGKRIVSYLEQEVASGNIDYYVASAADQVFVPPGGSAPVTGLLSQFFFLGGVWEKLDIDMQVEKIREYKTAGDMLANKSMTPAHREMANSLLDSINGQFVGGIAAARGLDPKAVQTIIDDTPMTPAALASSGLTDGVKFLDELRADLAGPQQAFLKQDEYQPPGREWPGLDQRPRLAVIYAVGPIHSGEATGGVGGDSVGSETLIDAFDKAAADDGARAIVFRVDSPGGSALASDLIWRATQQARLKKPVIVSMSDVAGSGGYYIAAGGTRIVAEPGTLTGSIGVVMAKPNIRGLLAKLGVATESLTRGKFARLEDTTSSLTPLERAKVVAGMTHIYDVFVDRVAVGRQLTRERVNEIGRGRVWTGAQAKENGLVDELGGFARAIEIAKESVGIPVEQDVRLVFYPQRKGTLERLAQYIDARAVVSLPPGWQQALLAAFPAWDFPDGALLTLMSEQVQIR